MEEFIDLDLAEDYPVYYEHTFYEEPLALAPLALAQLAPLAAKTLEFSSVFDALDKDNDVLALTGPIHVPEREFPDLLPSNDVKMEFSTPDLDESMISPDYVLFESDTFNGFGANNAYLTSSMTPTSTCSVIEEQNLNIKKEEETQTLEQLTETNESFLPYTYQMKLEDPASDVIMGGTVWEATSEHQMLPISPASPPAFAIEDDSAYQHRLQIEKDYTGGDPTFTKRSKKTLYSHVYSRFQDTNPQQLAHWMLMHFYPYIQPNGITFNHFRKCPETDEYIFKRNPKAEYFLPPRYTESKANYYEPLVVRYKKSKQERGQGDGEGLCPYCKSDNIDELFFERKDSNYLHHVTKLHGVYSNGMEMPFPKLIGEALEIKHLKTKGRTEKPIHSVECEKCHETIKIQQLDSGKDGNKFLAYYRHMLLHNEKKNSGKGTVRTAASKAICE